MDKEYWFRASYDIFLYTVIFGFGCLLAWTLLPDLKAVKARENQEARIERLEQKVDQIHRVVVGGK